MIRLPHRARLAGVLPAALAGPGFAQGSAVAPFTLTILNADAGVLAPAQVYNANGCKGGNAAPAMLWSEVPKGTRSLAVTLLDTTVPGGFRHWATFDIPPDRRSLNLNETPAGARSGRNDYGATGYGGACPPPGKAHHYRFAVWAPSDPSIPLPDGAPDKTIGDYLKAHALGEADLTFSFER